MSNKTVKLHNSNMPLVGFGTYLVSNEEAENIIYTSIKCGYRHIDTAQGYFNEEGIGKAIQKAISENIIKREDLYITTKLWPGNEAWGQEPKNYEDTFIAFTISLEKLHLEYMDLYLIHAPFAENHRIEQWEALINLQSSGKTKDIGVCNYNIHHFEEIKNRGLPLPTINQIELHPWSQKPELLAYMKQNSIKPMAYSSLVPLSTWREKPGQDSSKTAEMKSEGKDNKSPIKKIAERLHVSEAQVLLRWAIEQNIPVIPKSTNLKRMEQNLDLYSFELNSTDMNALQKEDKGSGVAWVSGDPSNYEK
ncbi:MAG: aldo/keto reductase [Spirochaetota bacterium]